MAKTGHAGRRSVPMAEARRIRERLREFQQRVLQLSSQAELSKRTGIGRATITSWFRGKPAMPTAPHLIRLARATNISLDWLLLGEGAPLRGAGAPASSVVTGLLDYLEAELKAVAFPPELTRNFLRYWRATPGIVLARMRTWVLDEMIGMLETEVRSRDNGTIAEAVLNLLQQVELTNDELSDDARLVRRAIESDAATTDFLAQAIARTKAQREAVMASTQLFPSPERTQTGRDD